MVILLLTLKHKLFTYYTAFSLMDSGSIASGLSFNGYDQNCKQTKIYKFTNQIINNPSDVNDFTYSIFIEKALFNRVENIRIWDIEFSYKV